MFKTFVDLYMEDPTTNMSDYLEAWHTGDKKGLKLYEYLGFTKEEWMAYLSSKKLKTGLDLAIARKMKEKLNRSAKSLQKIKEAKQAIKKAQNLLDK